MSSDHDGPHVEVTAPAREPGTASDIRLQLYVLDPSLLADGEVLATGAEVRLDERVTLRLLDAERYAAHGGPHVMSFAVEPAGGAPPGALAESVWRFLRRRRGGRGIVTARLAHRRWERPPQPPAGAEAGERHELWVAIPLGLDRRARRRIADFFAEVLAPPPDPA